MKPKYISVISGLCLFLGAGIANAGGGGHGCVYSGQIASVDGQSPLLANEDSEQLLDPELLLQLKQDDAEVAPEPIVHN